VDNPMRVSTIFAKAVEFGLALGWRDISSQPGCHEHQIDEQWWFAINPHGKTTKSSVGADVPAYGIYFEFNGWPAGFCDAHDGFLAAGSVANEDTLIAALDAATEKLKAAGRA
jgi:hypothetical protein